MLQGVYASRCFAEPFSVSEPADKISFPPLLAIDRSLEHTFWVAAGLGTFRLFQGAMHQENLKNAQSLCTSMKIQPG